MASDLDSRDCEMFGLLPAPSKVSDQMRRQAALTIARFARDAADLLELLGMCGLEVRANG